MMEQLSKERSIRLANVVFEVLATSAMECPEKNEGEVSFTRRVLCQAVRNELAAMGLSVRLSLKGDGTGEKALPASFLDQSFYPDLAISRGSQNLWAAEVKILRESNRQNSIATAFGQASLYKSRYEHVVIVFIDKRPGFVDVAHIEEMSDQISTPIIVRRIAGKTLIPFQGLREKRNGD